MDKEKDVMHVGMRLEDTPKPVPGSIIFPCDDCGENMLVSPASLENSISHMEDEGTLKFICFNCMGPKIEEAVESGEEIKIAEFSDAQAREVLDALKKLGEGHKAD